MRVTTTKEIGMAEARRLLDQPTGLTDPQIEATVRTILEDVRTRGEAALIEHTQRLDSPQVTAENLRVGEDEIAQARSSVEPEFIAAIETARQNIQEFHEAQKLNSWFDMSRPGFIRGQMFSPLNRVGVCVPGASAPLASTVLMTVVPARVAGVREVFVFTPPRRDGSVNPHVLAAAQVAGAHHVYRCFGAQAVGAMAFGAGQVPRMDKIVGPGNAYVVTAKRLVYGHVDIEALPGPSEILIINDGSGVPAFAAADLISQAEHPEGRAILLTTSQAFLDATLTEVEKQLTNLPGGNFARKSLETHGLAILVRNLEEAFELANLFAPEHLSLLVREPMLHLPSIRSAGTVLFGDYTSKAIDDYAAGPSHVLPTGGTARFSSGLGLHDFIRRTNVVSCSQEIALQLGPVVERMAGAEGLPAHVRASAIRREFPQSEQREI
ncbi:MAG: histidinol dehydrogenase [Armatimonadota bacterium]|nr:histidinol dehydrogenase [Armatimonadota bacterium]